MSERADALRHSKHETPILTLIIGLIIPALVVGWTALHANGLAPAPVGTDVVLIAFLTQLGLTIIYLGSWFASMLTARTGGEAGTGPVLICIAFSLASPTLILIATGLF